MEGFGEIVQCSKLWNTESLENSEIIFLNKLLYFYYFFIIFPKSKKNPKPFFILLKRLNQAQI
jgi:hypothetical protein